MYTASSQAATCLDVASASEYTATVLMARRAAVAATVVLGGRQRDFHMSRLAHSIGLERGAARHRNGLEEVEPESGTGPVLPSRQARRFSWSRELICDIRIGPRENSPTSAFRVSPRK